MKRQLYTVRNFIEIAAQTSFFHWGEEALECFNKKPLNEDTLTTTLKAALYYAFHWESTPQGHAYWESIATSEIIENFKMEDFDNVKSFPIY